MSFEFLTSINGIAQLWAADGQFLGVISSNRYDPYSISNPRSEYGSFSGIYSIHNADGLYGSSSGIYSPYHPESVNPPLVFFQEQPILVLSKNYHLQKQVNGLTVVDPDLLLMVYGQLANSVSKMIPFRRFVKSVSFSNLLHFQSNRSASFRIKANSQCSVS
jgi:hypothetical protein